MNGDFTRDTFDPLKHFSRVLMQQGRVQLDADWNEQTSILLHYIRTLASDLLGAHAGPAEGMGFHLITSETVKGWKEEDWANFEPDPGRREVLSDAVQDDKDAAIGVGRYYVQGILVENHRPILYTEQVGYPFTPEGEFSNLKDKELLVYLDVWERHVTYVQDDHIREVALGGPDTCARAQVVWQVKALIRDKQKTFDCNVLDALLERQNPPKLLARARRATSSPELCSVSPESKYRGLENHLYRVEVHEVGVVGEAKGSAKRTPATATFKWSRDNGSVVFPIVSLGGTDAIGCTDAIVATLGRDQCSQLTEGDWVEVSDDSYALRGESGPLAQVERVDRDELKITLKSPDGVADLPSYAETETSSKHPLLRRWDHDGDLAAYHGALPVTESATTEDGWIVLEDGVEIRFAKDGEYRVGDYWLIPARVATGDVEWPIQLDANGRPKSDAPAELPPRGPEHYFAPLYHLRRTKNGTTVEDCRCPIEKLPCAIQK